MRFKNPARIDVVKKEEKEARLTEFVRDDMLAAAARDSASPAAPRDYSLLVRSLQSPAALAVAVLAPELAAAGITLRLMVANPGTDAVQLPQAFLSCRDVLREARVLRDIRFLDAHEQLVLTPSSAWIGDCMRREPGKLDAYECYARDDNKLAGWGRTSFERMWAEAEVLAAPITATKVEVVAEAVPEVCPSTIASGDQAAIEVATRH